MPDDREYLPDIWLTSFWGYTPETWGCVGWTVEAEREAFLRDTGPQCYVAVYVSKNSIRKNRDTGMDGNVVGLMRTSRILGENEDFISPEQLELVKEQVRAGKWRYSVKVDRAWFIDPSDWLPVGEVATSSYWPARGRHVSRRGVPLQGGEIRRLLQLNAVEVPVYGGPDVPRAPAMPLADHLELPNLSRAPAPALTAAR